MKARFSVALLAISVLCIIALAQNNTVDYWYNNAGVLLANGSIEDSLKAYDKAIELDQNNATLWAAKGYALSSAGVFTSNQSRYNESLEALDRAIKIEPNNPRAWEFKGLTFTFMKRYNDSLDAYDRAIENLESYKGYLPANRTEYLSGLWQSKAISILEMGQTEKSLDALDNATRIDAENFGALVTKGEILAYLGRFNESILTYNDAIDVAPSELPEIKVSPLMGKGYDLMATGRYEGALEVYENISSLNITGEYTGFYMADSWRGQGNALASLGRYSESLQAFDKVVELSSENAPYAWTGKGDALLNSGRYDEAIIAYDQAIKLYPEFAYAGTANAQKGKGDALAKLGKREEALEAYGVALAASDKAITAFNNAMTLDKAVSFIYDPYPLDKVFWNNRGIILKALGRKTEADTAFAKAKELGYEVATNNQTNTSFTSVKMLAITAIAAFGKDRSVEITNSLTEARSFKGWTLNINDGSNQSLTLPDFILGSGKKVNIHFGSGKTNETDLFLNSSIALNDTAGNITLKNETGKTAASFGYRVEPDGSVTGTMVAKGEFSYPQSGSSDVKMVVREAGSGPYVTERTEYPPEISQNISERNPFQNIIQDYDRALKLDPGNASAWLGKAQISQIMGNHTESQEYFQKALNATNETLEGNSQDAKAWQARGVALAGLARNEEAIRALEKSIAILDQRLQENPEDADAWWLKAVSYEALYMDYAAIQAYNKVIELNSTKTVGAWIRIADILFLKKNGYNESVEAFNRAVELMTDNAQQSRSSLDQGDSILRTNTWCDEDRILRVTIGRYNKSIKEYDFIQQIVSRPVSTWLLRDNSIDSLKTNAEFVAAAVKLQENLSEGWYKASQELFKNGSYEESIKALNSAIELDSRNATLWDAKASSLSMAAAFSGNRSQYNESLTAQDKAIELDPENSTLRIHKGFLIASLADLSGHKNESLYEEALKEFDKAIELDPQDMEAWNYKGSVLDTRLNRSDEALLAYDKAIELEGANAEDNESLSNAWSGKGTALAKLGRYNESFEAFDKAIELNPQSAAFVWLSKGDALNQSGRYEEAASAYDKVVELNSDSMKALTAHAYGSKGDALSAWGKYDEAVAAYDKALEQYLLEPMGAQTWYRKGIALKALGRSSEADAAFAKAKELGYEG